MKRSLTIGDQTHDGLLRISDTNYGEGLKSLRVTVTELIGTGCWVGGVPVEKMRRFAKRAAIREVKGTRTLRTWDAQGSTHITFELTFN